MKWEEAIRRRKALKWLNKLALTTGYLVFATVAVTAFLLLLMALGIYTNYAIGGTLVLLFFIGFMLLWGSFTIQHLDNDDGGI